MIERIKDYNKIQPIIENYIATQSEGSKNGYPHFIIRTTGCTHRCFFGSGGWCDTWYTSIHPDKGIITLNDIKTLFETYPEINHVMITGGSPTMHPELVNEIIHLAKEMRGMFITIETEGSHFLETDIPIDLISLSPKFSNSVPQLGVKTPKGIDVDQKLINQHNKFRMNYEAIEKSFSYHKDYHFKPVIDRNQPEIWVEIENFRVKMNIPKNKTWVMPAGDTREAVIPNYTYVLDECIKRGYNFTGRAHIIAFGDKRMV